ncbi:MAG TPA: hypothetical protein VGD74_03725 [Vulgatibacter sp.]
MSAYIDRLIVDLAQGRRLAHVGDRKKIVSRLLEAEFSKEVQPVSVWDERPGETIVGRPHPLTGTPLSPDTLLGSDVAHLAKRIAMGSWPEGTTVEQ